MVFFQLYQHCLGHIRLDFHSESTLKYHYNFHNWSFDAFLLYCSKCVKFLSTGVTVNLSLMSFDIYVCWLSLSKRIWMLCLIPFSSSFPFSRLIMEACIMARSSVATKLVFSVSSDEFNNSFCCVENWLGHKLLWWFAFFLQYLHALVELHSFRRCPFLKEMKQKPFALDFLFCKSGYSLPLSLLCCFPQ